MTESLYKAQLLIDIAEWGFSVFKAVEASKGYDPSFDDCDIDLKSLYNSATNAIQWINKTMSPLGLHSSMLSKIPQQELAKKLESIDLIIPTNLLRA